MIETILICIYCLGLCLMALLPLFIKEPYEDKYNDYQATIDYYIENFLKAKHEHEHIEPQDYIALTLDNKEFFYLYDGKYVGHGTQDDFEDMLCFGFDNLERLQGLKNIILDVDIGDEDIYCECFDIPEYDLPNEEVEFEYTQIPILGRSDPVFTYRKVYKRV